MRILLLAIPLLLFGCKNLGDGPAVENGTIERPTTIIAQPIIPEGGVKGDFIGNRDSLFVFVGRIDTLNETTLLAFENDGLPPITIPESRGAKLQVLKLANFKGDVILVNAKPTDTNFNDYYLFVWNDSLWQQPVRRFSIHKSNISDTLAPIILDPADSTRLLGYYSVFEMDRKSEKKYTWRLMRESVPLED